MIKRIKWGSVVSQASWMMMSGAWHQAENPSVIGTRWTRPSVWACQRISPPHLKVWRQMQNSFANAIDYRKYNLKNNLHQDNLKIALRVSRLVSKLRSQLNEPDFNKMDPISILDFLKQIRDPCDSIAIHKGAALWVFSFFKKKPASSSLEAWLSPKKTSCNGTAQREVFFPNVDVFSYPLNTYATDNILPRRIKTWSL